VYVQSSKQIKAPPLWTARSLCKLTQEPDARTLAGTLAVGTWAVGTWAVGTWAAGSMWMGLRQARAEGAVSLCLLSRLPLLSLPPGPGASTPLQTPSVRSMFTAKELPCCMLPIFMREQFSKFILQNSHQTADPSPWCPLAGGRVTGSQCTPTGVVPAPAPSWKIYKLSIITWENLRLSHSRFFL